VQRAQSNTALRCEFIAAGHFLRPLRIHKSKKVKDLAAHGERHEGEIV